MDDVIQIKLDHSLIPSSGNVRTFRKTVIPVELHVLLSSVPVSTLVSLFLQFSFFITITWSPYHSKSVNVNLSIETIIIFKYFRFLQSLCYPDSMTQHFEPSEREQLILTDIHLEMN